MNGKKTSKIDTYLNRKKIVKKVFKVLVVDDEPDIVELVSYHLKKEAFKVFTAFNGATAIEVAKKELPDLILLDVMMPDMDGVETCVELRSIDALKHVFIAFLTARSEDYSQIAGFDAGADDYITKPIKPRVLVSRIKAMLHRNLINDNDSNIETIGGLVIDKDKYTVTLDGFEISFPKKQFELLALLTSSIGKVFTRDVILNKVWGDDVIVGDRTIDVHIRRVREKTSNHHIKTVKGVGYKFDI